MVISNVATCVPVTHCGWVMVKPHVLVAPLESISNPSGIKIGGNNTEAVDAGMLTVDVICRGDEAVVAPPTAALNFIDTLDVTVPVEFLAEATSD
jgi:hypothetical protein